LHVQTIGNFNSDSQWLIGIRSSWI